MWPANASSSHLITFIAVTLLMSLGLAAFVIANPNLIGIASIVYVIPAVTAMALNMLHHKSAANIYQPAFYGTTRQSVAFAAAYPAAFAILVAAIALANGTAVVNSGNFPTVTELLAALVITLLWMAVAFGEEYGWRGFLLPALAARCGRLRATIIVGLVWALYHLPAAYLVNRSSADVWLICLIQSGLVFVTAFPLSYCYFQARGSIVGVLLFRSVWDIAQALILGSEGSRVRTFFVGSFTIFGTIPLTLALGVLAALAFGWILTKGTGTAKEKA